MTSPGDSIRITILFFASAREAADNTPQIELDVPKGCDATTLRKLLSDKYPKLAPMVMDEESMTLALNEEYVLPNQTIELKPGDTVALIPPISGG